MKVTDRLKIAGKELLKANIGNVWKSLTLPEEVLLNPTLYRGEPFGKSFWLFNSEGGEDKYFNFSGNSSLKDAYSKCPPIAAILNRKAQAYINGKTWILNKSGKAKGKESTSEAATKIRRLILQPNRIQSGKQFEAQRYMYQQLYGYAIIFLDKPFGFPTMDAKAMWLIPNWMCEIEESKEMFYKDGATIIKSVTLTYKNEKVPLPVDNIFIVKDFRPSFSSVYLPESRVKSLEMPINNVIGAYESRNVLIHRRGPSFLVSNRANDKMGTVPLTAEEKAETEKAFAQYGLTKKQKQAIVTSASIDVTPIGFDVGQLKLMEEVLESSKAICDGFGYPAYLMGLIDPTFNNQSAADKGLYQNTIIPESESDYEQLNALFKTDELGLIIEKDYTHVTVLQEDKKAFASARLTLAQSLEKEFKLNWITFNRVLELMGEDTVTWGNIYYRDMITAGFVFGEGNQQIAWVDENGQLTTQNNSNNESSNSQNNQSGS